MPKASRGQHLHPGGDAEATGRATTQVGRHRRRRRFIVSGVLALGLITSGGGIATAHSGVPFGRISHPVVGTRTTSAHGALTVHHVRCWFRFWCRPMTRPASPPPVRPTRSPEPTGPASPQPAPPRPEPTRPEPTRPPADAPTDPQPTTAEPAPAEPTGAPTSTPPVTRPPATPPTGPAAPAPAPPAPPAAGNALAQQVLDQINTARAGSGLSPLTMSTGLVASATKHTRLMAGGCGMSHQCPAEAGLGARISAEGVSWMSVGENVGYGGPVARTDAAIVAMGRRLTASMLAETPPNDGHRRNILSSSFRHVGICLFQDTAGTVWMTQDFSN